MIFWPSHAFGGRMSVRGKTGEERGKEKRKIFYLVKKNAPGRDKRSAAGGMKEEGRGGEGEKEKK